MDTSTSSHRRAGHRSRRRRSRRAQHRARRGRQRAFGKLAPGGTLIAVGHATEEPESFPPGAFYGGQGRHGRSIVTFFLLDGVPLGPDLTWLAGRVAAGALDPAIAWRGGWDKAGAAVSALLERRLHGKAVLDL
ncbi:hypothetical protein [Nonomuraea sp. NPDC002799]